MAAEQKDYSEASPPDNRLYVVENDSLVNKLDKLGFHAMTIRGELTPDEEERIRQRDVTLMYRADDSGRCFAGDVLPTLYDIVGQGNVKIDVVDEEGELITKHSDAAELNDFLSAEKNTGNWDKPVDLFDGVDLGTPEWKQDMCPAVINEFAFDEAERIGVKPDQIAGPAIVAAAGCIDDSIRIQPKKNDTTWQESARIWGVVVGDSGATKSPAKKRADAALKEIETAYYKRYRDQMEVYEAELRQYEALSKKDKASVKPPRQPIQQRLITKQTTVEGLRDILQDDGGASKITCLCDEISSWLASFDAYRNNKSVSQDRAHWLEAYDGGSTIIDRANKKSVYVPNWSVCVSGTITMSVLSEFFNKLDSDGLLQRFLIYSAQQDGLGEDRAPADGVEQRYRAMISGLVDLGIYDQDQVVLFSDEALVIRNSFEKLIRLAHNLPGNTSAFNSHLNKYSGLFARLSLTYHLIDATANGADPFSEVSERTAMMVATVLTEYHLPMAKGIFCQIGKGSDGDAAAKDVAGYILAQGLNEITASQISANVWSLRNNINSVRPTLSILEALNWIKCTKQTTSGKPTRWSVNPIAHSMFKERAEKEKAEREATRKKILESVEVFQGRA